MLWIVINLSRWICVADECHANKVWNSQICSINFKGELFPSFMKNLCKSMRYIEDIFYKRLLKVPTLQTCHLNWYVYIKVVYLIQSLYLIQSCRYCTYLLQIVFRKTFPVCFSPRQYHHQDPCPLIPKAYGRWFRSHQSGPRNGKQFFIIYFSGVSLYRVSQKNAR